MEAIIEWFGTYWWMVLIVVGATAKVLNKATKHFSEHKGFVKWALFVVDVLDIVKTTPAPGAERIDR